MFFFYEKNLVLPFLFTTLKKQLEFKVKFKKCLCFLIIYCIFII